jgi:hypothetical protein
VLKILNNYDISATFFLVGYQVEKSPEIARQIVAAGHEIGNHSFFPIAGQVITQRKPWQKILNGQKRLFIELLAKYLFTFVLREEW